MIGRYTIGQLARAAEVPVSTVRYYERRRLLRAETRSGGNYRLYGDASLERLRFIRSARAAGFTLSDVGALLEARDGEREPCGKVQSLIDTRLAQVEDELRRLRRVKDLLARWLAECRTARRPGRCGVLELLTGSTRGDPENRPR